MSTESLSSFTWTNNQKFVLALFYFIFLVKSRNMRCYLYSIACNRIDHWKHFNGESSFILLRLFLAIDTASNIVAKTIICFDYVSHTFFADMGLIAIFCLLHVTTSVKMGKDSALLYSLHYYRFFLFPKYWLLFDFCFLNINSRRTDITNYTYINIHSITLSLPWETCCFVAPHIALYQLYDLRW